MPCGTSEPSVEGVRLQNHNSLYLLRLKIAHPDASGSHAIDSLLASRRAEDRVWSSSLQARVFLFQRTIFRWTSTTMEHRHPLHMLLQLADSKHSPFLKATTQTRAESAESADTHCLYIPRRQHPSFPPPEVASLITANAGKLTPARIEAMRQLACGLIDSVGGRLGLYDHRDIQTPRYPIVLTCFVVDVGKMPARDGPLQLPKYSTTASTSSSPSKTLPCR